MIKKKLRTEVRVTRPSSLEDLEVGDVFRHPRRTVLAADNVWFRVLSQNVNKIHFDCAYAAKTEFGRPLVDST